MNSENHSNDFSESQRERFETNNSQAQRCEEIASVIPAHGIGATDPEEAVQINALLADCPQAAADLATFGHMATQLLYSAPPVKAPSQIGNQLRAAIAASRPPISIGETSRRPAFLRKRSTGHVRRSNKSSIPLPEAMADYRLEATPKAASNMVALETDTSVSASRAKGWYFGRALATAAAVSLLVVNVMLLRQNQQLMAQQQSLNQTLAQQNQALILLSAEEPQEVEIFDPDGVSSAQADILWNNSLGIAVVYVRNFPQCESGMKYQLWLMKNGQRSSGGLFSVDTSGMGLLVIPLEDSLDTYDAVGITPEPATGSPGPTSPPIVRGEL